MNTAELDDFMVFNDQVAALIEAGVPINVGLDGAKTDSPEALEAINAIVAHRMSLGQPLERALEDERVPVWYRYIVLSGLRSGNQDAALSAMSRVSNSADESRYIVESALFYPLIVCTLAYLGMIGFCLFFVPTLEQAYGSLQVQQGSGLRVLQALRDTLPYWAAAAPILLLIYLGWRWLAKSRPVFSSLWQRGPIGWLMGLSRAMFEQRSAYFAESLASLEDNGMPLEKALPVAAGAYCDSQLAEGAQALATTITNNQTGGGDSAAAMRFPPFLRWALFQSESTVGRSRALRMAAALYRQSAGRRMERSRLVSPLIALVVLGGGVTLLYCLAVFVPVVQLLRALS